ncbi:MAG: DM13 domain-containing protein [Alphaproteobacteria bacterium]
MIRKLLLGVGAIVVIVVAAAAWILVSPLFIDEVVDEKFPGVSTPQALSTVTGDTKPMLGKDEQFPGVPTSQALSAMPSDKKREMAADVMAAARSMPDKVMAEVKEPLARSGEPVVLRTGVFRDADRVHKGSGDAILYRLANGENVLRFENLKVTNGPDLHVYLVRHPGPKESSDVTADNYIDLGPLKGNIGNQNYAIPADADVGPVGSVVVWCQAFGVLFSAAALSPAGS